MQERTRTTVVVGLCLFFIALVAIWWYFGFSLDFMRFFAAEPDVRPGPTATPPPGCYYQEVQCIQAPCPPQLICPEATGMVSCAPLSQTVRVGAQAVITATSGAGLYTWYAPDGTPPGASDGSVPGARFSVSYAVAGTKKVTVQSPRVVNGVNDPANQIIDSVACTIIVTP